jgi:paraquat-inducible protein A
MLEKPIGKGSNWGVHADIRGALSVRFMTSGRRSFILGLFIIAATVCLVLGLTLPIIRLTRFYVWTDVHSLVSVVRELYLANEIILASVVLIFSIIFPFLKLLYLLALYSLRHVRPDQSAKWLKRLSWLGKWSMLDVLVLALVVFYAKATNLADATSMPGIFLFAGAVILTMIATAMIEHDIEKAPPAPEKVSAEDEISTDFNGNRLMFAPVGEPQDIRPFQRRV